MTILLAPSEEKLPSANHCGIDESAAFAQTAAAQLEFACSEHTAALDSYFSALKTSPEATTGAKNPAKILAAHGRDAIPALERYTGVAFTALDYPSLTPTQQAFAREHIIIFSNLFGALRGGDLIPYYKLKQGVRPSNFPSAAAFCAAQSPLIDAALSRARVTYLIDLRAEHYAPFYTASLPTARFKFTQNGRALSHYSKHYRGLLAREIICAQTPGGSSFAPLNELKHLRDMLATRFAAKITENPAGFTAEIDFKQG